MNRLLRLGRWTVVAVAVLLLFWVAATIGGWSPDIRRLTTSVHGPLVADYRADSPQALAPLSPEITQDASRDRPNSVTRTPAPTPSGSATPAPSGSSPLPTLPVPTPSIPPTPTLPIATPTLPVVTPTPVGTPTPPVTPPLPTPPPLP
jgi:hypothetical protein